MQPCGSYCSAHVPVTRLGSLNFDCRCFVDVDKASNNVVFVCKHILYPLFLFNELGMGLMVRKIKLKNKTAISLSRKYFLATNQFFHHMVYRLQIMIFRYYIGYLNCTKIIINKALLQDHPFAKLLTIKFSPK